MEGRKTQSPASRDESEGECIRQLMQSGNQVRGRCQPLDSPTVAMFAPDRCGQRGSRRKLDQKDKGNTERCAISCSNKFARRTSAQSGGKDQEAELLIGSHTRAGKAFTLLRRENPPNNMQIVLDCTFESVGLDIMRLVDSSAVDAISGHGDGWTNADFFLPFSLPDGRFGLRECSS